MRRKGSTPSNKEIIPQVRPSGISNQPNTTAPTPKPPAVLRYPEMLGEDYLPAIKDTLAYVIKPYALEGLSVIISKDEKSDNIMILFADWFGNKLDLLDKTNKLVIMADAFLANNVQILINFMRMIKVKQAQYFFSGMTYEEMILVDMQTSLNKMCGPGMIRDLFSKIMKTQEVIKVEPIDERAISAINIGNGIYEGDIILKPSRFRQYHNLEKGLYTPLYVKITR